MALRFRKSIKIAPGVKMNLGKKSIGMSAGGKHGGVSINSRSGARVRASAPGTGLSYNTKIGGSSMSRKAKTGRGNCTPSVTLVRKKAAPLRWWFIALEVICVIGGLSYLTKSVGTGLLSVAVGIALLVFTIRAAKAAPKYDVPAFANEQRILDDSIRLMKTTENPETFFGRFDDGYNAAQRMAAMTSDPVCDNESPQAVVDAFMRQQTEITNAFLDRYSKAVKLKAFELSRGRQAKIESFKLITGEFEDKMTPESISYRDDLYADMKTAVENI